MDKLFLSVALASLCAVSHVNAANRCTVNGKTVYQDMPCDVGGSKVNTQANGPAKQRMTMAQIAEEERKPATRKIDHQAVTVGMATGRPVVGMTVQQLTIAMGNPNRRNTGDYGNVQTDQLIYERQGITFYVYVRDGSVSSVQTSEGYRSSYSQQKRCPSSIEIRNMQTSANSDSISESQRRELLREIREGKECS